VAAVGRESPLLTQLRHSPQPHPLEAGWCVRRVARRRRPAYGPRETPGTRAK